MMCDYHCNFAQPWSNNFYYQYIHEHAIMSRYFQKLHSSIYLYGNQFYDTHPTICCQGDYNCCCSSCSCSSCSCTSDSCSSSSSEYEETDDEEGYDEEQYEDENYDEDESECEYEFNVDAILAMRAAKEELKKQEQADLKSDKSPQSKYNSSESSENESYDEDEASEYDDDDEESNDDSEESNDDGEESIDDGEESKDEESVSSKDEKNLKCDSIDSADSDKDDFELIDLSNTRIMDSKLCRRVGGFNKAEEEENKKLLMEYLYGSHSDMIIELESQTSVNFDQECDDNQPTLWPVLPLRLSQSY